MTLEAMKAKILALTDEQILEGVRLLAPAAIEATKQRTGAKDERLVRAYMIEEWENRHGEAAADRLMDELGM